MGIKQYSKEEELQIVDEYIKGLPVHVLMDRYNFKTKKSITDKVKKYYPDTYEELIKTAKENRKNYTIDLSIINNEFKAYLLGLLLTDGYIQDNNKFGIQLTDEDCIKFISDNTGKEYKKYESENNTYLPFFRIIFSSADQVKAIERYGVVKNKSRIIEPPQLSDEEKNIFHILFAE